MEFLIKLKTDRQNTEVMFKELTCNAFTNNSHILNPGSSRVFVLYSESLLGGKRLLFFIQLHKPSYFGAPAAADPPAELQSAAPLRPRLHHRCEGDEGGADTPPG